ncbi:MAG TPA: hypothetical protein EYP80_00090 [Candidatus Aenigmarchaeota archaeon]|nr:hypothetical protein [Candidatus Aenigmarchaeota archaeon]
MVKLPHKWVTRAYSKLWVKFKNKEFNHDEASKTLKEDKMVSVILSEMKKAGWLEIKHDPTDSRRRLYKLISPKEAVKEIARG